MCLQTCILFRTQGDSFDGIASKMYPVLPGQVRAFIASKCTAAIVAYSAVTLGLTQGRISAIWQFVLCRFRYMYMFLNHDSKGISS